MKQIDDKVSYNEIFYNNNNNNNNIIIIIIIIIIRNELYKNVILIKIIKFKH